MQTKETFKFARDQGYHFSANAFSAAGNDEKLGGLVIEGWLATFNTVFPESHHPKFKIEREAFGQDVIDAFLQKPILLWSHDMDSPPIGKVLSLTTQEAGAWVRAVILNVGRGTELIPLIKNKIIRSLSFGFFMEPPEYDEDTEVNVIKKITAIFDASVVNLGRNEDAVFEVSPMQTFKQQTPRGDAGHKGVLTMEMSALELEKRLTAVTTDYEAIKKEAAKVVSLEAQVKTMLTDGAKRDGEVREFMDKFMGDYKVAMKEQTDAIKLANQRSMNMSVNDLDIIPFSHGQMLHYPETVLRAMFKPKRFDQIDEFRHATDMVVFVDAMMAAYNPMWKHTPAAERLAKLKCYQHLKKLAQFFAMDTATSNEGSQFIPTAYSSRMFELIRLETVVDSMFETFTMSEASQYMMVEGADILATRHTQTSTLVAAFDSTEQTPGSANAVWAAEKLRTRVQTSGEITEDSINEIFDYVQRKSAIGMARSIDKWWISGDNAAGTSFDSGDAPGATDCRYCGNGLRYIVSANSKKLDMSTFSPENLMKVRALGGKYMKYPRDMFWLCSIQGYLLHFLNKGEIPEVATLDKYGPMATVFSGELGKYMGAPIIISEWILDTFDEAGVYSAAGKLNTIVLAVSRPSFKRGTWRPITQEIIRDGINDVYDIVTWHRTDIQNIYTATEAMVTEGYNISTT